MMSPGRFRRGSWTDPSTLAAEFVLDILPASTPSRGLWQNGSLALEVAFTACLEKTHLKHIRNLIGFEATVIVASKKNSPLQNWMTTNEYKLSQKPSGNRPDYYDIQSLAAGKEFHRSSAAHDSLRVYIHGIFGWSKSCVTATGTG